MKFRQGKSEDRPVIPRFESLYRPPDYVESQNDLPLPSDARELCGKSARSSLDIVSPTTDYSERSGAGPLADSVLACHVAEMSAQELALSSLVSLRDRSAWFPRIRDLTTKQSQNDLLRLAEGPSPSCVSIDER